MSSLKLLWDNLADDCSVTATAERSGFPATYVQHPHLIKRWRSLVSSAAQRLTLDAGNGLTLTADHAAVCAHNLSAGSTLKIQANSSDSWDSPAFEQAMDEEQEIPIAAFAASKTYRFWSYLFDDSGNEDGYIEVGRVGLYLALQPAEGIARDLKIMPLDQTIKVRTPSGQSYSSIGPQLRVYEFSLDPMEDAARQAILAAYAAVGKHTPIIIVPHSDVDPLYCTFEAEPSFSQQAWWMWKGDVLRFVEER